MGEIVNLRLARKQRARQAAQEKARQNRARHGRTAAEQANDRLGAERAAATLEGKRLTDDPRDGDTR